MFLQTVVTAVLESSHGTIVPRKFAELGGTKGASINYGRGGTKNSGKIYPIKVDNAIDGKSAYPSGCIYE